MTREEAIDILVGVIAANSEEENEALDMAIEALSDNITESPNEAIKRRNDAIDLVRCKDCRHRIHDEERCLYYCEMYYGQGDVSDDNFCQWGAKMDGDMSDGERSEGE